MNRNYSYFLGGLLLLALIGGALIRWFIFEERRTEVTFLNVGQGDAILISQGMNQVLIDGGRTSKELLSHLGRNIPFWDRKIELIIATHPDADHIGGFPGLLQTYRVDRVLTTGAESETDISQRFREAIQKSTGSGVLPIFKGTRINFPYGGELDIEYPILPLPKETADANSGSIVARFIYGETTFLLTGDLPHEEEVLPDEPEVTVLKAAHHGSKYSTSEAFLERIKPKEAVISVGKNNYGHPAEEVLKRLGRLGAIIHRTDQEGDIGYRCFANQCVLVQ